MRTKQHEQNELDHAVTEIQKDIDRLDASLSLLRNSDAAIHRFAIDLILKMRKERVSDLHMAEKKAKFGPWDWNQCQQEWRIGSPETYVRPNIPFVHGVMEDVNTYEPYQVIVNGQKVKYEIKK